MKWLIRATIFFGLFCLPLYTAAVTMTGGDYQIYSDTFSVLEGGTSTGGVYTLSGSGWQGTATTTSGGNFVIKGGFQAETVGIITYSLSKQSISLGTLSSASVSSDSLNVTVSTDAPTGYTLAIAQDGQFRSGSNGQFVFANVQPGGVLAGTEGYGIRTVAGSGLLSADTAIADGLAVASTGSAANNDITTIQFRASIAPGTRAGTYQHTVTFTLTVNP